MRSPRTQNGGIVVMHQAWDHLSELVDSNISYRDEGTDCLLWTHKQLHQAATRIAMGLLTTGVQRGSTLVTLISNRVEWAILLYATSLCGLTLVSLDYGALSSARQQELHNHMKTLSPAVVIVSDKTDAEAVDTALFSSGIEPAVKVMLDGGLEATSSGNWMAFLHMAQHFSSADASKQSTLLEEARKPDPDRVQLICFTSGTSSGNPKGCPRHVASMTFVLDAQAPIGRFDTTSRFLSVTANFRIIAPVLTMSAWKAGAAIVMPSSTFNPETTLEAFERFGITHIVFVPALLYALINHKSYSTQRTRSLRYGLFGGDMITKDFLRKARAALPYTKIATAHGMSEGGALFHWPYFEADLEAIPDYGGLCTLGTIGPGSKIRIYDIENERLAKKNETGEFQIQSPGVIKHYLGQIHEEAFLDEESGRWFRTGDVGMVDSEGLIFLLGRLNDRIKRSGVPIMPAALETCIDQFTGSQTSVFGIPHPELGHEPFAVVKQLGNRSESQVKQHVIDLFGKDYALGGICTLQQLELDEFPLNATGKIMKITLAEKVLDYLKGWE